MKTKTFILAVIFLSTIGFAQEQETSNALTTKKGFVILPEAGDIAIGFDAIPVIDFFLNAVNIMNNTGQTAQHPGFVTGFNNTLVLKYFVQENLAARLKFGWNKLNQTHTHYFYDPADIFANPGDPDKWDEISDVKKTKFNSFLLAAGGEFRRGHNRLQGFVGGELIVGLGSNKTVNTWGVEINQDAIINGYTNGDGSSISPRILYQKSGTSLTAGLRGFLGIEYFVLPKISIGAEFGLGIGMISTPRGEAEIEYWDAADARRETDVQQGPNKVFRFGIGIDDGISSTLAPSSALTMYFHF